MASLWIQIDSGFNWICKLQKIDFWFEVWKFGSINFVGRLACKDKPYTKLAIFLRAGLWTSNFQKDNPRSHQTLD